MSLQNQAQRIRDRAFELTLATAEGRQVWAEKAYDVFLRGEDPMPEAGEQLVAYCRKWGLTEPMIKGVDFSEVVRQFRNRRWTLWGHWFGGVSFAVFSTKERAERELTSGFVLYESAQRRDGFLWQRGNPLPALVNLPVEEQKEAAEALYLVEQVRQKDPKLAEETLAELVEMAKEKIVAQRWKDLGL